MPLPVLDTALSPLWVVRFPETIRVDEYRSYLEQVIASYKEGERYGMLLDFQNFKPMSGDASTRAGVAQALRERMSVLERFMAAEVRVVPNPVLRAMATVFDWTSPFPWPTHNVGSMPVADSWIRSRLAQSGITVPAAPALEDS